MFEKEKSKVEDLTDELKEYLNTRADLAVLKISDKLSDIVSTMISGIVMAVVFFFFLLFSSFAFSIWLGNILENNYLGFLCVAVIYLIIGVFHKR
jgi:Putative Actinobacterial Holin-X, holin superfamily III